MTSTHETATAADDVELAVALLRRRGLRVSAARRLVLAALAGATEPLSADAIAGGADGRVPRSDLASVYRNLDTLETLGLVRHVHLGHGPGLYALAAREREYLVCEACSAVVVAQPGQLDAVRDALRHQFGFDARFSHFPVVGLCRACGDAARATDSERCS